MLFELNARMQSGKSAAQADLLEHALQRGRRVLVCRRSGNLLYQRFGHLTSITPQRENPLDLWLDGAPFEHFHPDDDPPLAA